MKLLRLFLLSAGAGLLLAVMALASPADLPSTTHALGSPCAFPAAGPDNFPNSAAEITVDLNLLGIDNIKLEGPVTINRGPVTDGSPGADQLGPHPGEPDGLPDIQTEIVSMSLTGNSALLGPVTLRAGTGQGVGQPSFGAIEQKVGAAGDLPAKSFFDVFFEIDIPSIADTAFNQVPARMATTIYCIPPFTAGYETPPDQPVVVNIFLQSAPLTPAGQMIHAKHIPLPEKPLFSVRPGGPSGLNPADVYTIFAAGGPPAICIADAALGLAGAGGDDVDALSSGELIGQLSDIRFSVDDAPPAGLSIGLPGTGVRAEATKIPPEAHGDEFNVPAPGTNALFMDEGLFGLLVSDDIDGLDEKGGTACPPPVLAFSLATGSPALGAVPASPADILLAGPVVAVLAADLGLMPGAGVPASDDLDALCWFDTDFNGVPSIPGPFGAGDEYLFSLAPGSPTLGVIGASSDDLLAPLAGPLPPPPVVAIAAPAIGLRDLLPGSGGPDDVDALKCPLAVDCFGRLLLDVDNDRVADCFDNCPDNANGDQRDFEKDRVGDACDHPDNDGDGVNDEDEGECGDSEDNDANGLVNDGCPQVGATSESDGSPDGGPQCANVIDDDGDGYPNDGCPGASEINACGASSLDPTSIPERLDGAFGGADDNKDGSTDELLPAGSSGFDCDGDGWTGAQEQLIFSAAGTANDQDPCGNNGWAADVDPSNFLNIGDINSFTTPARVADDGHGLFNKFGHPLDDDGDTVIDPGMARWNLDTSSGHTASTVIDIGDVNALTAPLASTAAPPMYGGAVAFLNDPDGPGPLLQGECPWSP